MTARPSEGPRLLSLCSGYGGLDMAVRAGLGGRVAVFAENDPCAAAVFAAHHPGVPNLGDITRADWRALRDLYAPDVVVAGFPCQDISNAGRRVGIGGKRSGIWKDVAAAVRVLRPRLVFLENVAAIRSRGLDVVAQDLAQVGYDARWTCVRAGDPEVGAAHPRDRWFALAYPAAEDADLAAWGQRWAAAPAGGELRLLPTPASRDWKSGASNLLGVNSRPLNEVAVNLLPTPKASDGPHGGPNQRDTSGRYYLPGQAVRLDDRWVAHDGTDYGPAIRRWEHVTGRPAPCPTEPGTRGNRRLAAAFAEWLMGLDAGHVTGRGLARKDELRIIGAGVVPQQGHHAFGQLLQADEARPSALDAA
ncbi:DNA cytosine methyltransferase [Streptomyces sp. SP17BM10]|uniref:DNA cytosine methyltransferase n=1 Tax=Streptomyces sp. SP17BM10 TaxID=3002530 RepID=UPI002E7A67CA|nr:DNA cytosine methyltransferase [Streptomyces sp. SP17BM10]MEE1787740.1 DNA cytosine methyltransferase [Streptomyces sp. SP17BM10]